MDGINELSEETLKDIKEFGELLDKQPIPRRTKEELQELARLNNLDSFKD